MADKTLTATTSTGDVLVVKSGDMPGDEPGHKGAELNGGATPFDPNAAYRHQQGFGAGMQDSERLSPAHWVQSDSAVAAAALDREERRLRQRLAQLADERKAVKRGDAASAAE